MKLDNNNTGQSDWCLSKKTHPASRQCENKCDSSRHIRYFPAPAGLWVQKVGVGPSITSNISVSNLMRRCEWILKQAREAPGKACAGPPGPAAGLNKYAAEQTCWQLGPEMAAAVCVVALQGR